MWRTTKSVARHTRADITCVRHNACLYFVQCSTAAPSRMGMTHKKNAWKAIYQKDFNEQKQFFSSRVNFEGLYAEKVQKLYPTEWAPQACSWLPGGRLHAATEMTVLQCQDDFSVQTTFRQARRETPQTVMHFRTCARSCKSFSPSSHTETVWLSTRPSSTRRENLFFLLVLAARFV